METTNISGSMILIEGTILQNLLDAVVELQAKIEDVARPTVNKVYNNKDLKEILGIQDKLIKKYRDEGLLAYSQVGDKFWYQWEDIQAFLNANRLEAYNIAS